jgi:hypothetical protein
MKQILAISLSAAGKSKKKKWKKQLNSWKVWKIVWLKI